MTNIDLRVTIQPSIMNLLEVKKVDRPYFSKKTMECETKGSEQDDDFDEDTEDEIKVKKRKNLELGSSSRKKRKIKEIDSNLDTNYEEELEEGNEKICIVGKVSKNMGNKMDRA